MNIDFDKLEQFLKDNHGEMISLSGAVKDCEIKPVDCNECAHSSKTNPLECMGCINNKYLQDNFKPKPKEWYEKPESFPCLCWLSDVESDSKDRRYIGLITGYHADKPYSFKLKSVYWKNAIPLTKKELMQYCVVEK